MLAAGAQGRARNELFTSSVNTFFLAGTHAMSSLNVGLHNHVQKSADPSERSKLQIVSREPFSAFASFLLGMSADLAAATGLFVLFLR
jgi:hypothetical protein